MIVMKVKNFLQTAAFNIPTIVLPVLRRPVRRSRKVVFPLPAIIIVYEVYTWTSTFA